jgi:hypothetical protein
MRRLLLFSALAALAAAPAAADVHETAFRVRPGHPVRLVAVNVSRGDHSLTWAVVNLDGRVVAVDLRAGLRAETLTIVTTPGWHHATLVCDNYNASVVTCTLDAVPAG